MNTRTKISLLFCTACLLFCLIFYAITQEGSLLLYIFMGLFAVSLLLSLFFYFGPPTRVPWKKLLVCAGIVLLGAALSGVIVGVLPRATGWTPVGFGLVMSFLPLAVSLALAAAYWNRH